jgi:hypothetical protein
MSSRKITSDIQREGSSNSALVPTGGTTSQVLTKNSSTDNDVSWTTPSGAATTLGKIIAVTSALP